MKLKTTRWLMIALIGLACAFAVAELLLHITWLVYVAIGLLIVYFVVTGTWWRCPKCGAVLGRANVKACPQCGHKLEL